MLWHVFHKALMTEPLHKQSYDIIVKRISNMQQLTSNFLKKCAFRPHSRAEPGLHAPPLQISVLVSQTKFKGAILDLNFFTFDLFPVTFSGLLRERFFR